MHTQDNQISVVTCEIVNVTKIMLLHDCPPFATRLISWVKYSAAVWDCQVNRKFNLAVLNENSNPPSYAGENRVSGDGGDINKKPPMIQ